MKFYKFCNIRGTFDKIIVVVVLRFVVNTDLD